MARPAQPLDPARQAHLFQTARIAFATNGFQATRNTAILQQAEFQRSSFYYFFDTKERLFDAAFADGLRELSTHVHLPDIAALTQETFWPALTQFMAGMSAAAKRADLTAVGTMFHMADRPNCSSVVAFTEAVTEWTSKIVDQGLALGVLDPEIPAELHVELAYEVVSCLDRWAVRDANASHVNEAPALVAAIVPRMLGQQQRSGKQAQS